MSLKIRLEYKDITLLLDKICSLYSVFRHLNIFFFFFFFFFFKRTIQCLRAWTVFHTIPTLENQEMDQQTRISH